jgi:hypothetical protein
VRKNNSDFDILAGLGIDFYRPRMLLYDDAVSDRKAEAGTIPAGFVVKMG